MLDFVQASLTRTVQSIEADRSKWAEVGNRRAQETAFVWPFLKQQVSDDEGLIINLSNKHYHVWRSFFGK